MRTIADLAGTVEKVQSKATDVEVIWESQAWGALSGASPPQHISVLDSSFNPPTLAHLSLALIPPALVEEDIISPRHIAHLLLLSVRNADKGLKPGDPSLPQRLQMMILLAEEMENRLSAASVSNSPMLAVATIDEPTFVGKSTKLLQYFRGVYPDAVEAQLPRLTFVLGFDTIIRLFNPKYYGSDDGMIASLDTFFLKDHSSVMCARRRSGGSSLDSTTENEIAFLQLGGVRRYVELGAVMIFGIDSTEAAMSSTLVRQSITAMAASPMLEDTMAHLPARNWRSMVLPAIAEYITWNGLYVPKG